MPEPYYKTDDVELYVGDCLDVLRQMPDASVDACVTDPPAGIRFMGKDWDSDKGGRDQWVAWLADVMREVHRVLKPGGHALVWALPRTSHWTATALEDAGLEIRDCIVHIFGSGFPKSLDVSKAIDKAAGVTREVVGNTAQFSGRTIGRGTSAWFRGGLISGYCRDITIPATEEAARWEGWGTALKPGQEHWWLCRRPLDGTVAANVLEHGTGALNIDASRVPLGGERPPTGSGDRRGSQVYAQDEWTRTRMSNGGNVTPAAGRWPTNLVFSHSAGCVEDGPCQPDCPVAELDRQSGVRPGSHSQRDLNAYTDRNKVYSKGVGNVPTGERAGFNDIGGASRFFPVFRYEAKAPNSERPKLDDGTAHPTVKSVSLTSWLVRLVTPPGGVVLDPFAGSGTTGEAAVIEGFRAVLIELDPTHAELIKARLSKPLQPTLFSEVSDGD